ncbi:hypothetical protein AAFC00_003443 [Neodothiora populina]|uniref:CPAF-like PDZ domain-containing protein n=1 Tax=Neodothiora populina TaxID=2781224 RepID=A0ABR3PEF5_9PEZI
MIATQVLVASLVGLSAAAPWSAPKFPDWSPQQHPDHPGWKQPVPYIPPQPKASWNRPYPSAYSTGKSGPTGSGTVTAPAPTASSSSTAASTTSTSVSTGACASVSKLVASFSSASPAAATASIPAQVAYDCLHEIPFNQSAALALMDSIEPYLNWQTTLSYLKSPPDEYAQKIQPPYDFFAVWEEIRANASAGAYASEYEFGWPLYKAFQNAHDGHFAFYPDSVTSVFTFGRTTPLVSLSVDGESLPQPYVYADILTASFGNASFTPSYITEINGQDAIDYLLDWSQCGSLQDRDALWNNLFYIPAQVSLGSSGTGTGTFSGSGRGRFVFPGPTTTFTFANGTTVTNDNYARVLVDFSNITTGADIYNTYFATLPYASENAFDLLLSSETSESTSSNTTSSAVTSTAPTPTARTTTPAPGYPTPVVRNSYNENAGYFLSGADYADVAVLALPSFAGTDEVEFQNVNSELIAAALAANKTKLIIDVSANAGGTILQGYDIFKQLFPSILPYGATRFRAHKAFDLLGQEASELSGRWPRSLNENYTVQDIESSSWNYRSDADVNYEPFTSWPEKFGPHAYGPADDNFTSIIRWNLSDPLIPDNSGGIYVSGYLNRTNVTVQPFEAENIIIVYDGYCASTCTIFSELMRQQAGVKTIALGGRPNKDIIQAVGGVKGTNDFPYSYIFESIEEIFSFSNASDLEYYNSTALGDYTQLPLYRAPSSPVVNSRDGIRQGDESGLPLQFRYETADCRIFYTPEMVVDETVVWKTVADTVWKGGNACVAGSNDFYGSNSTVAKRRSGSGMGLEKKKKKKKKHAVRRDVDVQALWDSLDVETVGFTRGGDGVMVL